ncbi:MAG: hypothetical protein M1434_09055 [Chloroflexi bacterium]|nr:hypothetical protein [Chloroflexota bacterium]MCL5274874.1 hypothetical protein [Chloroflexota bacterium]
MTDSRTVIPMLMCLPFVWFQASVNVALKTARDRLPGVAEVLIFPHGGITCPALR